MSRNQVEEHPVKLFSWTNLVRKMFKMLLPSLKIGSRGMTEQTKLPLCIVLWFAGLIFTTAVDFAGYLQLESRLEQFVHGLPPEHCILQR